MTKLKSDTLIATLRAHPQAGAAQLCVQLGGINKSTLTRALAALDERVISRGGSRRIRYALRRPLRGNTHALPLYRIDEAGRGEQLGWLDCIQPSGTAVRFDADFGWPQDDAMRDGWFEGLPYPLADMRPQGFLGRNFAQHRALDFQVSANPDDWSDDDVLHVLSIAGFDQPGNLILGEAAYRRWQSAQQSGQREWVQDVDVAEVYTKLAASALAHGDAGSSVAGEFPKFTTSRMLDGLPTEVIVKFSGADGSPAVQRWADLLVCEHIALEIVQKELGVAAAQSRIYQFAGRTFLEVVRFDRHGASGRSAVCTLSGLNAALIGKAPASWTKIAQQLLRHGWLGAAEVERIALIEWFGRLIANTDMHEGNLAFRPGLALAPIYDMLPMHYAPARGGEVPQRSYQPALPLPNEIEIWQVAAAAAMAYWQRCADDARISADFRVLCRENAVILAGVNKV